MKAKLFKSLKIKVIVFFIAFLIWFFVKTEHNYKYSFGIPIRVSNLGENRIVKNDLPSNVLVTFWGKGRDLLSLMMRSEYYYNIDVSKIQNKNIFLVDKHNIRSLRKTDIDVLNILSPESIEVEIAELKTRNVAIRSGITIETQPGYTTVGDLILTPDSATLIGPEYEIQKIAEIMTEEKEFKKIKRDIDRKINLVDPQIKHVKLVNEDINIFQDIQKLMEKPLTEIPLRVTNLPKNLKASVIPSTLSLVLEGGADLLLDVTQEDIEAYIDYDKVRISHEQSHLAYIVTPNGIRYRDVKPKRFKIVVEKVN